VIAQEELHALEAKLRDHQLAAANAQREAAAQAAAHEAAAARLREREAEISRRVSALEEEQAQLRRQ
jgi:hypothetical protein